METPNYIAAQPIGAYRQGEGHPRGLPLLPVGLGVEFLDLNQKFEPAGLWPDLSGLGCCVVEFRRASDHFS